MVDDLPRVLADALAQDADHRPVEVGDLLAAARRRARRTRRRRAVVSVTLAALVLAAVPVGSSLRADAAALQQAATPLVGTGPGSLTSSAPTAQLADPTASGATAADPAASGAAASDPTASGPAVPVPPTESPVNPDAPAGLAGTVLVPPEAMLGPADLPFTPTTTNDYGPYLKNRTMVTSLCGDGAEPGEDLAVGGRQISYLGSGRESLATTARVFSGDGARQQLTFLRASLGTCRYLTTYTAQDATGVPGDEALIGTAPSVFVPGGTAVIGTVRDGNTTAGVQTDVPGDVAAATVTARDLLTRAHRRLVASGLPAAHPG